MNERKKHEQDDIHGYLVLALEKIDLLEREVEQTQKKNINLEERLEVYEKTIKEKNDLFMKDTNDRLQSLEYQISEMMYLFDEKFKTLNTVLEKRKDTPIEVAYKEAKILKYGVIVWTIQDYQNKLEAEKISNDGLYSNLFLSSENGYVLRLVAYLNGWASGKGSHLGLCIQVAKGPNDEILQWPFPCKMRLSILHPTDESKHKSKTRNPQPGKVGIVNCSFFRPTSEYNIPNGLRCFVSHESIVNKGFLSDDTIHVMCKII